MSAVLAVDSIDKERESVILEIIVNPVVVNVFYTPVDFCTFSRKKRTNAALYLPMRRNGPSSGHCHNAHMSMPSGENLRFNYHITLDYQNYSVPYEYVRKRVDVRLISHIVEIYSEGRRIASHKRLIGRRGQYSTLEEHMPKNHQLYSQWDGNRFRRWSAKCGNSVHTVVERFDVSGWHSQLGGGAVADAIMDRIIPGSYRMKLEGDVSMQQRIAEMTEE